MSSVEGDLLMLALALLIAATTLVSPAGAAGPCRTSFAGCRTPARKPHHALGGDDDLDRDQRLLRGSTTLVAE